MGKIYFAHPVNLYGDLLEEAFLRFIAHYLTDGNLDAIENPNQPHHQEGYRVWAARAKENSTQHRGMNYFFDEVLPKCKGGCVALPFLDGRMGLGVAGEAKWFLERSMPVWIVKSLLMPTYAQLKEFVDHPLHVLLFELRPLQEVEGVLLLEEDPQLVVPHEETRLRTWTVYNREKRPYELAHLAQMPIPEGFYPVKTL